jgi:hypothetical protein
MQSYQPYGQQYAPAPGPTPGGVRKMHKTFGITYIAVRSVLNGLVILFVLFAASMIMGEDFGGDAGMIVAMVALIFLVWLGYAIAGGILAIKGHIAGPIMGLIDTGGSTILFLISAVADGNVAGGMCWIVPNILLIVFAILALKERGQPAPSPYGRPGYGQPQYGQQPPYGQQPYAPQPAPQYPPQGYAAPAPAPALPSAAGPSPKQAALGILAIAASMDPEIAEDALTRARAVAAKLLGPTGQARIRQVLARPIEIADVDQDLMPHTAVLNQSNNLTMKNNVVKAVEYVLKGPNGIEPLGEGFITTLKQQLGA